MLERAGMAAFSPSGHCCRVKPPIYQAGKIVRRGETASGCNEAVECEWWKFGCNSDSGVALAGRRETAEAAILPH